MGRMAALYGLGFAAVWVAILAACLAGRLRQRNAGNWDRAFVKELMRPRINRDPGRTARPPATRPETSWETDPT